MGWEWALQFDDNDTYNSPMRNTAHSAYRTGAEPSDIVREASRLNRSVCGSIAVSCWDVVNWNGCVILRRARTYRTAKPTRSGSPVTGQHLVWGRVCLIQLSQNTHKHTSEVG